MGIVMEMQVFGPGHGENLLFKMDLLLRHDAHYLCFLCTNLLTKMKTVRNKRQTSFLAYMPFCDSMSLVNNVHKHFFPSLKLGFVVMVLTGIPDSWCFFGNKYCFSPGVKVSISYV